MAIEDDEDIFLPRDSAPASGLGGQVAGVVNRPEIMAALLQFGLSSLSGQSFGTAVGEAGEAVSRHVSGEEAARTRQRKEQMEEERHGVQEEERAGREEERRSRQEDREERRKLAGRKEERAWDKQGAAAWAAKAPVGTTITQGGVPYVKGADGKWQAKSAAPGGDVGE